MALMDIENDFFFKINICEKYSLFVYFPFEMRLMI